MTQEQQWKAYVDKYPIEVPEELVEQEMHLIYLDLRHRMQYEMLTGDGFYPFPDMVLQEQETEIREAAVFEVKSSLVMKQLLTQREFPVSREELEAEAEAMARRQNTTVAQIKDFLGEDLSMLERDIRERKVLDWALGNLD